MRLIVMSSAAVLMALGVLCACQPAPNPPSAEGAPAVSSTNYSTQKSFVPDTCSAQNNECNFFCAQHPESTGCSSDCYSRMTWCMRTGEYVWRFKPNAVGLIRE